MRAIERVCEAGRTVFVYAMATGAVIGRFQEEVDRFRKMTSANPHCANKKALPTSAPGWVSLLKMRFDDLTDERKAEDLLRWGIALRREIGELDVLYRARVTNWVGAAALRSGRLNEAAEWLESALACCEDADDRVYILNNLAIVQWKHGQFLAARRLLNQALDIDAHAKITKYNLLAVASLLEDEPECRRAARELFNDHPVLAQPDSPIANDPDMSFYRTLAVPTTVPTQVARMFPWLAAAAASLANVAEVVAGMTGG